jgi:hypothetical protein
MTVADTLSTLKQIVDSSAQLSAWALTVLGGTVATIVSTSYRRPDALSIRLPYLLFLPGWAAVGYSLYLGNLIVGKYLAALMVSPERVANIAAQINDVYGDQRFYLFSSLVFFGLWLVIYLLLWIFLTNIQKVENK